MPWGRAAFVLRERDGEQDGGQREESVCAHDICTMPMCHVVVRSCPGDGLRVSEMVLWGDEMGATMCAVPCRVALCGISELWARVAGVCVRVYSERPSQETKSSITDQ